MDKNIGFLKDEPKEEDYVFGSSLPFIELQPNSDWTPHLPDGERQNKGMEPYACVAYTILNIAEILIERQYGITENFSDRFLAAVSGTKERKGNSPRTVADFLRKLGAPKESVWPYINNYEEYYKEIPREVYKLAEEFNKKYILSYEFVPKGQEERALKCSPLLVSVPAWYEENGVYYRPEGIRDGHATTLIKKNKVFDTYDPIIKDIDIDHEVIMRFMITKKEEIVERLGIIAKALQIISNILEALKLKEEEPVKDKVEVQEEIKLSNREKLYNIAMQSIGYDVTPRDIVEDEFACSEAVCKLIQEVIPTFPIEPYTLYLYRILTKDNRFKRTIEPKPGNIIISPTELGKPGTRGHVGIHGKDGKIMSNNSANGIWTETHTIDSWVRYYRHENKYPIFYFELV